MTKTTEIKNGLIIDEKGNKRWYEDDVLHRENGPAVEYEDDTKYWFVNGKKHREDGPAVKYTNGYKEYWINNKQLTEEEFKEFNIKKLKKELEKKLPINSTSSKAIKI